MPVRFVLEHLMDIEPIHQQGEFFEAVVHDEKGLAEFGRPGLRPELACEHLLAQDVIGLVTQGLA